MQSTFIDSYGKQRVIPVDTTHLKNRAVAAVIGEVLEVLQRTKDKYVSTAPITTPEYVATELWVNFSIVRIIFFSLQRSGLLRRTDSIKLSTGRATVYEILRDVKEDDLHYVVNKKAAAPPIHRIANISQC